MHIPDGMLSTSVCLAGYGVTFLATSFSIKRINQAEDKIRNIPKASLLTAAFFLLSLISIPVPPASIHLLLNGLLGALLGYFAFLQSGSPIFATVCSDTVGTTMGINALLWDCPRAHCLPLFKIPAGSCLTLSELLLVLGISP